MFQTTTSNLEDIPLPVFSEGQSIVVDQPNYGDHFPGQRRPIPVSVIDVETSQTSYFAPNDGLDFLREPTQFIIQQSIELSDLMASLESENRYVIKTLRGDTLYSACETSQNCERGCFGSSRSFEMRIYDASQQLVMEFRRRLACGTCTFWPYLQRLEVWAAPGEYLGTVSQNWSLMTSSFDVYNGNGEVVFKILGPDSFCCLLGKTTNFNIYNPNGFTQVGTIIHQWDQVNSSYNLSVQTPGNSRNCKNKALIIAAAFLLEYMYFNTGKKTCCLC